MNVVVTNQDKEKLSGASKRMSLLFVIIFFALAVLIFRLSFVQLSQGERFLASAETNRYIELSIPAPRGSIYDRDKVELVGNKPAFTITYQILSGVGQNPMDLIGELHQIFEMTPEEMYEKMDPQAEKYGRTIARKIISDAKPQQVAYVREHANELPGINVVVEPIRSYRFNNSGSHVLGYLNNIDEEEWPSYKEKGYQQNEIVGWAGVEKQYEEYLHGQNGKLKVEVNRNYQPMQDKRTEDPVKGHDLILTLDKDLQAATEQALKDQVQALKGSVSTVEHAAAIAMNPKTGEILSMASYPDFDPNMYIKGFSTKEYNEQILPGIMNRAIQQVYQPGSTVKMSTVLIGLKEGMIYPGSGLYDSGAIQVGWTIDGKPNMIASWQALGYVDPVKALAVSSNVYMIDIFKRLGKYNDYMSNAEVSTFLDSYLPASMKKILAYHSEFGLGKVKTGVDLPYEEKGSVTEEKNAGDLAFSAIGQSEHYTLMQLAQYVSTIANDGKRMEPHIVSEIIGPDNKSVKKFQPKMLNKISFTDEQIDLVQRGMRDVIAQPYGTFYSVLHDFRYPVAAKTGTAETGRGTENSLFVGYAPYDNPEVAIAIIIPDNKKNSHSYDSVGPIAHKMFDTYFKLKEQKQLTP
ncbi:penicillin-binding protein 2 [Tumebacillus sp. BK434]|nr:penicillin-binding protein 2 [Tumebacillus sp. BK434]